MSKLHRLRPGLILYCLIFLAGFGWTLYIAMASAGVAVQDEIAHFLISKHAWQQPELLLSLWGRPVRNVVYWIPALFGLSAARIASIAITGITIIVATRIGSLLGIQRVYLIPLFIWFQPWVSELSFAVLPQIPFGFLLTIGVYLGLKDRYSSASLAFGLLPLTRHEGIAVLGIWLLFLLILRDWRAFCAAFLPLITFNALYFFVNSELPFNIYLDAKPTDRYGAGDWLHFIRPLPDDVGQLILSFCAVSIVPIMKSRRILLVFVPSVAYLATHTLIYRYGLFASGGYQLFLLPLAPAIGLAAAFGLEYILSLLDRIADPHRRQAVLKNAAILALILVASTVVYTGLTTKPIPLDDEGVALQEAAVWLQSRGVAQERVYATHVWLNYFYDIPLQAVPPISDLSPRTVIVWDAHYSERYGILYDQISNMANCWVRLESFGEDNFAVIFAKSSDASDCS